MYGREWCKIQSMDEKSYLCLHQRVKGTGDVLGSYDSLYKRETLAVVRSERMTAAPLKQ